MKKLSYTKISILMLLLCTLITLSIVNFHFNNIHKKEHENKIKFEKDFFLKQSEYKKKYQQLTVDDPDEGIKIFNEQLSMSNEELEKGLLYEMLYYCYLIKDDAVKQKEFYSLAETTYSNNQYGKVALFSLYENMMNNFLDSRDYKNTLATLYKATAIIKEYKEDLEIVLGYSEDDINIIIDYNFLEIASDNNIRELAKDYFENLNKYNEDSLDTYTKIRVTSAKYQYFYMEGNSEKQKEYAEKTYENLQIYDKKYNTDVAKEALISLVQAKLNCNETDNIEKYLKISEDFFKEHNNETNIAKVYNYYGKYYDKINDYDNALSYYNKALKLYLDIGNNLYIPDLCRDIINLNERNNKKIDVTYYKHFIDSVSKNELDQNTKNLISVSININNSLNEKRINAIKEEKKAIELKNKFQNYCIIILIIFLITLSLSLIKVFLEIQKRKLSEKKLQEIVNTDYLTKTYSKGYGYSLLENLISSKTEFYMAIIDGDNFKSINDTYGHLFGDTVLQTISSEIKKNIGEEDFLIRFGGEEFILVLKDKTEEEAFNMVENCRKSIENTKFTIAENIEINVTISIGFSKHIDEPLDDFIVKVDKLLYRAKNNGKNRIEV